MQPAAVDADSFRGMRKKEEQVKSVCKLQIMLIGQCSGNRDKAKVQMASIVNCSCNLHCGYVLNDFY